MREQWQKTFKTYRCHSSTTVKWLHVKKKKKGKKALQCRRAKTKTISLLSKLTAPSCLLSPCCVRADIDGLRWAFGRLHRVVWECCVMKESLAHVLSYSVLERLCSEWSRDLACPILQSSLSQVTNRCCRWLAAPLFWLFPVNMNFSWEVSVTLWVIMGSEVNKPTGGEECQVFPN